MKSISLLTIVLCTAHFSLQSNDDLEERDKARLALLGIEHKQHQIERIDDGSLTYNGKRIPQKEIEEAVKKALKNNEVIMATNQEKRGKFVIESVEDWQQFIDQGYVGKIVREIEIRGNVRVSREQILEMIKSKVGEPFDRSTWDADWDRLTVSGLFWNVRTTPAIALPPGVVLVLDLVEYPKISKLKFKDNGPLKEKKILAAIKTLPNTFFNSNQAKEDARNLERLYFEKKKKHVKVSFEIEMPKVLKRLGSDDDNAVTNEVNVICRFEKTNEPEAKSAEKQK